MEKLIQYRCLIRQYLQERADLMNSHPISDLEAVCCFDVEHDIYLVINLGWHNRTRFQYIILMARIREGKIWIEEDSTEESIANYLVEAGVPKSDIVIAFNPPELRHLTEFAMA